MYLKVLIVVIVSLPLMVTASEKNKKSRQSKKAESNEVWVDWSQASESLEKTEKYRFKENVNRNTNSDASKSKVDRKYIKLDKSSTGRKKDLFELQKRLNSERPERLLPNSGSRRLGGKS